MSPVVNRPSNQALKQSLNQSSHFPVRTFLTQVASALILCNACFAITTQAASSAEAQEFYGAWRPVQPYNLLKTRDGKQPPLTAAAHKIYEANLAARKRGDLAFDGMATCKPPGLPRLLTAAPFWLLPTDGQVVFLSEWNQFKWSAKFNDQHTHNDDVYYLGNNVASWDGKVMVIDSNHFNDVTLLDQALPHSESLQVVERLSLVNQNTLENIVTITDPQTFTAAWTTVLRFERLPSDRPYPEDVCLDRVKTPFNARAE